MPFHPTERRRQGASDRRRGPNGHAYSGPERRTGPRDRREQSERRRPYDRRKEERRGEERLREQLRNLRFIAHPDFN